MIVLTTLLYFRKKQTPTSFHVERMDSERKFFEKLGLLGCCMTDKWALHLEIKHRNGRMDSPIKIKRVAVGFFTSAVFVPFCGTSI